MQRPGAIDLAAMISATRREDPDGLQDLLGACRPLLKLTTARQMRRRFRGRFDESDVVQLVFLEATNAFPTFRGDSDRELLAWLHTILKRVLAGLYDHHSLKMRDVDREVSLNGRVAGCDSSSGLSIVWNRMRTAGPGPRTQVIEGERAVILAMALQQLHEDYRKVIGLRFLDGLKIREIAESMNTSIGRVAGLLRRGLEELHALIPEDQVFELGGDTP